jgi:RNA polymerase sigma-70 factor (ECF subfamily)
VQAGDDQRLIQQAQAGERAPFAALVERYWDRVFRWLYSLTQHAQLAEDLTQETFLRVWKGLGSFQPGASFRAWVFSIARHCLIDGKRGPRGTPGQVLPPALADKQPGPVEAIIGQEGQHLLQQACTRLPEHFREAFLLWAQDDLPFAEVAQVLGITEETARWRVFKARLLLLKELGSYLDRKRP